MIFENASFCVWMVKDNAVRLIESTERYKMLELSQNSRKRTTQNFGLATSKFFCDKLPGPEAKNFCHAQLSSAEHEILNAHKSKNYKKFSVFQAHVSLERYFSCS